MECGKECVIPLNRCITITKDGITLSDKPLIKNELPKRYIFNGNATILIFNNDSKVVVKTMDGDEFDPVLGFLTAYFQKHSGLSKNKANDYLMEVRKNYEEKTVKPVKSDNVTNGEGESVKAEFKFKNGDRVKVIMLTNYDKDYRTTNVGDIGTINDYDEKDVVDNIDCCIMVEFDNGKRVPMYKSQLELIEREEK